MGNAWQELGALSHAHSPRSTCGHVAWRAVDRAPLRAALRAMTEPSSNCSGHVGGRRSQAVAV
jgi:hypothetical protein